METEESLDLDKEQESEEQSLADNLVAFRRRAGLIVLSVVTIPILWMVYRCCEIILTHQVAERGGYLLYLCSLVATAGLAAVIPFWGIYRGKLPLYIAWLFVGIALLYNMQFNVWVYYAIPSNTGTVNFYDYMFLLIFSGPGMVALYNSRKDR